MTKVLEKRLFEFRADSVDESGGFKGYAHRKNEIDAYGDLAEGDNVYRNIPEFIQRGFVPVGHDWAGLPVAYIKSAREDSQGLYVEVAFHSDAESQRARTVVTERMDAGKFVGLSIGFWATDVSYEKRDEKELRIVKGLELAEVSIVTVPAVYGAGITEAKGAGSPFADHLSAVLAANEGLVQRFAQLHELRQKDGRGFSEEKLAQLGELRKGLEELTQQINEMTIQPEVRVAPDLSVLESLARHGVR